MKRILLSSIRPLFFIALGIAVFWFISSQLRGPILEQLDDIATARGLITFVVATATVAGAIILVLAAIAAEGTENDVKMRLNEGRQVLAPLIGILGTIVGFYFGQPQATQGQAGASSTQAQAQALRVGPVTLSAQQVAPGAAVTVTSSVTGGRPPYTYTIILPGVSPAVADKLTAAGDIKREITIAKDAKPSDVTIQVTVEDSSGASAGMKAERPLKVGS
jgi:hypothetical protein